MKNRNIILNSDSYKFSHHQVYPRGLTKVHSYIESRGGMYDQVMFFGLQAFIKEYLLKPITQADIDFAEYFMQRHTPNMRFNREGWEYILHEHNGYLPIKIRAPLEGTVVPYKNVLCTVENTDDKSAWLVGHIETILLRAIWSASTAASRGRNVYNIIKGYLEQTSTNSIPETIVWMLHDFGMRGAKSQESSGIAGAAHLIHFWGSDNLDANFWANEYYDMDITNNPSFVGSMSVPASEHSVATMYGKDEIQYLENMVDQFGCGIFSVVGDSYDIYNFVDNVVPLIKDKLISKGGKLVVRPDSGEPVEVVTNIIKKLYKVFGATENAKGYLVLNNVGIIQGDGITEQTIDQILKSITDAGFAAENLVFGCGGYLLDTFGRDTNKWAMKASAAIIDNKEVDIFKNPITDSGKKSKSGFLELIKRGDQYKTIERKQLPEFIKDNWKPVLRDVFVDGELLDTQTFNNIRSIAVGE